MYTGFRTMPLVALSTERDMSSSARGTHCTTSLCPSPRRSARRGLMTVVFPWPMTSCFTLGTHP